MPIKIIADYRELLIDIFFAIVIAVGLDRFVRDFLLEHLNKLSSFDFASLSKVFFEPPQAPINSETPIIFDMLFFFAAYFWVISHWVFYHELLTKYPYYRWRKFFVDITLFTIMFVIVNISFTVGDKNAITLLFVWLLILWYTLACLWHLTDIDVRPIRKHLQHHTYRLITYIVLIFLLYDPLSLNLIFHSYRNTVMIAVILAMILWNVYRLSIFLHKDSRVYLCDYFYLKGYPGGDLSSNAGQLELIRYPMKKKIGDTGKDIIVYESDSYLIEILPENINEVSTKRMSDQRPGSGIGLVLQINCNFPHNDGTIADIDVLFDLNDRIIGSVRDAIEELCKRNKHGTSP